MKVWSLVAEAGRKLFGRGAARGAEQAGARGLGRAGARRLEQQALHQGAKRPGLLRRGARGLRGMLAGSLFGGGYGDDGFGGGYGGGGYGRKRGLIGGLLGGVGGLLKGIAKLFIGIIAAVAGMNFLKGLGGGSAVAGLGKVGNAVEHGAKSALGAAATVGGMGANAAIAAKNSIQGSIQNRQRGELTGQFANAGLKTAGPTPGANIATPAVNTTVSRAPAASVAKL